MLRDVQTAAWDWEPRHMSGYPHLPPPATTVPSASCPPSTPAVVPPRPPEALSAPAAPLPLPPPHGDPPPRPPLPYGAPP